MCIITTTNTTSMLAQHLHSIPHACRVRCDNTVARQSNNVCPGCLNKWYAGKLLKIEVLQRISGNPRRSEQYQMGSIDRQYHATQSHTSLYHGEEGNTTQAHTYQKLDRNCSPFFSHSQSVPLRCSSSAAQSTEWSLVNSESCRTRASHLDTPRDKNSSPMELNSQLDESILSGGDCSF
jgi:hypothetical protein